MRVQIDIFVIQRKIYLSFDHIGVIFVGLSTTSIVVPPLLYRRDRGDSPKGRSTIRRCSGVSDR